MRMDKAMDAILDAAITSPEFTGAIAVCEAKPGDGDSTTNAGAYAALITRLERGGSSIEEVSAGIGACRLFGILSPEYRHRDLSRLLSDWCAKHLTECKNRRNMLAQAWEQEDEMHASFGGG